MIFYIAGFLLNLTDPSIYETFLSLDVEKILQGQVWRLFTFLIESPSNSLLFVLITLYFYYMIGVNLDRVWGSFRFNFFFFMGVILTIISAFVIYFAFGISNFGLGTFYINLSLYLAFAMTYPDMTVLFMLFIPVKIKWLALVEVIIYAIIVIFGFGILYTPFVIMFEPVYIVLFKLGIYAIPANATAVVISMLNFVIFYLVTRQKKPVVIVMNAKRKKEYTNKIKATVKGYRHKCAVCGRTDVTNPELSFRYCSKCEGEYEYCNEHLMTHVHVRKSDMPDESKNVLETTDTNLDAKNIKDEQA